MLKRALIVFPRFTPSNAADSHRVRQSLPYYREAGWEPTVLAVDPDEVSAPQDALLLRTIPDDVEVVRTGALPRRWTQRVGVGSLEAPWVPENSPSLHWPSQKFGPNWDLKDAVRALPHFPDDGVLSLHRGWAEGFEGKPGKLAEKLGGESRLRRFPHCLPEDLVGRIAERHVGLALEVGEAVNSDLCVTNKLFANLAGPPMAATATTGQGKVCVTIPEATRLYDAGDPAGVVHAGRELLECPIARESSSQAGVLKFGWNFEDKIMISIIDNIVVN